MATAFDFGGLLGSAFGGGSALEDLLTEQQKAAIRQQGALSAAAALLQAAGPSTTRSTLGQALGSAFAAGQAGTQKAQESVLTQMLTRQKLEEARRAQGLQKSIADILTGGAAPAAPVAGGAVTAEEALAAPGMPVGPTVERAALMGQPRPAAPTPALSANEVKARQYRQIADVYAAAGRGEDAKRYMDIAENLMPSRPEVVGEPYRTASGEFRQRLKGGGSIAIPAAEAPEFRLKPMGQPFEVTDEKGKAVLVQQFEDGSVQTLPGFGPKREVVLQTVDGKVQAIDKSKLAGGETFGTGRDVRAVDVGGQIRLVDFGAVAPGTALPKTLAPQVVGGAETGYFQIGGGGGRAPVAPAAGAAAPAAPAAGAAPAAPTAQAAPAAGPQPIIPGTGPKAPEAFSKAARQLNDLRGAIADYKKTLNTTDWVLPKSIPIPFTDSGIALPTNTATAAVSSRYNSLLMGVKNLYELGALTGPDLSIIERQVTNPASWAGILTSKSAMNEQVKVLEDMLDRGQKNLETAYKQKVPEAATLQEPAVPSRGAFPEGAKSKDRQGKNIVFRNGQWVYE